MTELTREQIVVVMERAFQEIKAMKREELAELARWADDGGAQT